MPNHVLPTDAPAPPEDCEWKHAEELELGDEIYAGAHSVFDGVHERFFLQILTLDPKPKTIYATVGPTDSRLMGVERRRFRRDEWLGVRT